MDITEQLAAGVPSCYSEDGLDNLVPDTKAAAELMRLAKYEIEKLRQQLAVSRANHALTVAMDMKK